jgi:hypothetical protein
MVLPTADAATDDDPDGFSCSMVEWVDRTMLGQKNKCFKLPKNIKFSPIYIFSMIDLFPPAHKSTYFVAHMFAAFSLLLPLMLPAQQQQQCCQDRRLKSNFILALGD